MPVFVPGASKLPCGEALRFTYVEDGRRREGFLLRTPAGLVAYENRCPHLGVDLDMGTGRFFAPRLARIYCQTHGATFLPESGLCDAGPCAGMTLTRLPVREAGEGAFVEVEAPRE